MPKRNKILAYLLCSFLLISFLNTTVKAESDVDDHRRAMACAHQMKLKGGARITFKHAYTTYLGQMRKWEVKMLTLERKYDPHTGTGKPDTKILSKLDAEKEKLQAERIKIEARLDKKLGRILTVQQLRHFHNSLNKYADGNQA